MSSSHEQPSGYPLKEKGARSAPDARELRVFIRSGRHEGGMVDMPAAARAFARRTADAVTHYPDPHELPNWLRAMIEKKVPAEELARTLQERLRRAPSEDSQEMALLLANEIARMPRGAEALAKHITPELLRALSGEQGRASS